MRVYEREREKESACRVLLATHCPNISREDNIDNATINRK